MIMLKCINPECHAYNKEFEPGVWMDPKLYPGMDKCQLCGKKFKITNNVDNPHLSTGLLEEDDSKP